MIWAFNFEKRDDLCEMSYILIRSLYLLYWKQTKGVQELNLGDQLRVYCNNIGNKLLFLLLILLAETFLC